MLNARLYRVALVPFLLALGVAAFSLGARPAPLSSSLAPDAFEGPRALAEARSLARAFPQRRPGSPGDERLAAHVAAELRGLGGTAGGGFSVRVQPLEGRTIDGTRRLLAVIAQRPGSTGESPIVIVAHRDAAGRGATAELSGTAVLLGLARVFAARETKRAIVLVSTSGGSGGDAAAAWLAGGESPLAQRGGADAAIVLGDLASAHARRPEVIPYSDAYGSAPLQLQRTVAAAVRQQAGADPGAPSFLGQLAHLAIPLAPGEQGALDAAGLPSVLLQASGERGPASGAPISAERIESLGRAAVSSIDALDEAPDVETAMQTGLVLSGKTLPAWAVSLLALALILAPLAAAIDGLARARRRRVAIGRAVLWTLSCALPFLACAVLAYVLGGVGIVDTPSLPVLGSAMPFDGRAAAAVASVALTFLLAWLLWGMLLRRLSWPARPDGEAAGLAVVLVLAPVALIAWASDPYTALLLVVPLNLWLVLAAPELPLRRSVGAAVVALGAAPALLVGLFYCHMLGLGPGEAAWMALQLVAGGHVAAGSALLWGIVLGAGAAALLLALVGAMAPVRPPAGRPGAPERITIRGPLSYAGPGSLGGTESALRR